MTGRERGKGKIPAGAPSNVGLIPQSVSSLAFCPGAEPGSRLLASSSQKRKADNPRGGTMHATLAFLNAAGRHTARLTPNNRAFMRVMNALLAIVPGSLLAGPRRKPKSKKARRQPGGNDTHASRHLDRHDFL